MCLDTHTTFFSCCINLVNLFRTINFFNICHKGDFDHPGDKVIHSVMWWSTEICQTHRKKTNSYVVSVSSCQEWALKQKHTDSLTDPVECWHQNQQTEEINCGIESTNSCQPSLRNMTGSAVVRTTERKWEGTDGHAPFGWQTAQPWERCGTDSFYKEIYLTQ